MWSLVHKLIELIFPLPEDVRTVNALSPDTLFTYYSPRYIGNVVTLLPYHEPDVRACLRAAKFHHHRPAIEQLATVVAYWLQHTAHQPLLLIPIPLSAERERKRGHNQVSSVLTLAIAHTSHRISPVLVRTRDTPPQTSMSRTDRMKNLVGAFVAPDPASIRHQHILLVDDVLTTGATMRAAKAALSPLSPASLTYLAFAH